LKEAFLPATSKMTTKAAALAIRKGGQKEAISAKKDAHARDLEIGLNATMQKVAFFLGTLYGSRDFSVQICL